MKIVRLHCSTQIHREDLFNLIESNRSRLENFYSATVERTLTPQDTKEYCQFIAERIAKKLDFPYMISDHMTGE
ncbi:MAG: hypothetical protein L7V86_22485 [Verrucomicrobiales bacterium]|nr:hypothetical protein [Verrucomicrobiales bacterium]MDC0313101.1 hypothetical protein [Verrucomicrobiales bacterium]